MLRAIALGLVVYATAAAADPRPSPRGDNPPKAIEVKTDAPLSGPLAPQRAREWLVVLAPSFPWGDALDNAKIGAETRAAISLGLDIGAGGSVTGVDLRVYKDLVAVAEVGTCCCGSCVAAIHFFSTSDGKVADVTDAVWPRFRHVTDLGTTFDRLSFRLGARQVAVRDDRGVVYKLRRDRKSGRFKITWKRLDAQRPY